MPNGKIHYQIWNIGKLGEAILFLGLLFVYPIVAVGTLIGYWLGQFIDPDMDLVGITSGEGRMLRRFPIMGGFFVAYWTLYGAIFRGKHRSFWTHSILVSTALRFSYMFWWLYVFVVKEWKEWMVLLLLGIYLGLSLADTYHIIADWRKNDTK